MGKRILKILFALSFIVNLLIFPMNTVVAIPGDYVSTISEYEFESSQGALGDMERINDSEYFAVVYQDSSNDGVLETILVHESNGTIQPSQIALYEFAPADGLSPAIIQVHGTGNYLLCWDQLSSTDIYWGTVGINEDGTINNPLIDSTTLAAAMEGRYPNMTYLENGCYVTVYQEPTGDTGYISTLHVNDSGTLKVNDTWQFDSGAGTWEMRVVPVDNNTVAISYRNSAGNIQVQTINITTSPGDIVTSCDNYTSSAGGFPTIHKVYDSDFYIVPFGYQVGAGDHRCNVGSIEIDSDGNIAAAWADEQAYTGTSTANPVTGVVPIYETSTYCMYGIFFGQTGLDNVAFLNVTTTSGALASYGNAAGNSLYSGGDFFYFVKGFHVNYSFYVWSTEGAGSDGWAGTFNTLTNWAAPEITPYPANNSVIGDTVVTLTAYVTDDNGDDMTIDWYTNISGSWERVQTNASVANGTYTYTSAAFQSLNYENWYYWRVDARDFLNIHNTSNLYRFMPINFTFITNESEGIDLQPNITININQSTAPHIDNITWYFYNETSGDFEPIGHNETNGQEGNYTNHYTNITECCSAYYWGVELWNSTTSTSYSFQYDWFTTLCPYPPSSFNAAKWNGTAINLTWSRWSHDNASGTAYTVVRYRNDTYPTSITDGVLLYNGTGEYYNFTGLTEGNTYYFSAWTVYVKNTSWCESPFFTTDALTLTGGTYNITIRYENNNSLMSPAIDYFDNLRIIFMYQNGTVIFNDTLDNYGSNPFSVDVNETPATVLLTYEYWGTIRSLCPAPTVRNLTFWVSPRPYWDGNTSNYNISQLYYVFTIDDLTNNMIFLTSEDTRLYIYRSYNSTVVMDIHQMYLSSGTAWAFLEYGQIYFFGIECAREARPYLNQSFPALSTQTWTITVYPVNDSVSYIRQFVNFSTISRETNLSISYTDSIYRTTNVEVIIYKWHHTNGSRYIVKNYTRSGTSSFFISWTDIEGYENNQTYLVEFNVTHAFFDNVVTVQIFATGYVEGQYDANWINNMLDDLLGPCPFGAWTRAFTFGIATIFLIIFATSGNGEMGLFVSGLSVVFMQLMIFDDPIARVGAAAVGGTMVLLAIIFYMGKGRGQR